MINRLWALPPSNSAISPMMVPGPSAATTSPSRLTTLALPCTISPTKVGSCPCRMIWRPAVTPAGWGPTVHSTHSLNSFISSSLFVHRGPGTRSRSVVHFTHSTRSFRHCLFIIEDSTRSFYMTSNRVERHFNNRLNRGIDVLYTVAHWYPYL